MQTFLTQNLKTAGRSWASLWHKCLNRFSMPLTKDYTWVELSGAAAKNNMELFRRLIGPHSKLGVAVKSNSYGHGMIPCSQLFLKYGADWLLVNSLWEAEILRQKGNPAVIKSYK